MSSINGTRLSTNNNIRVQATRLTAILNTQIITEIDLLSLDVEGYEYNVLHP